jgi:chlorophyll(ide) b reductase
MKNAAPRATLKANRMQKPSLKVVITGGTRGLGKAMRDAFEAKGDMVFIASRSAASGPHCARTDIGLYDGIPRMFEAAKDAFGGEIDLFLNCAAVSGGHRRIKDHTDAGIDAIIRTNLTGTVLCCKHAFDAMKTQSAGGSVYNFMGNGSNGWSSPNYAVYGCTKSAVKQLTQSLRREWIGTPVHLHTVSPGLMPTDLLMENMSADTYAFLERMCSTPERVAHHLVPRIRNAFYQAREAETISFLTPLKIGYKLLSLKKSLKK